MHVTFTDEFNKFWFVFFLILLTSSQYDLSCRFLHYKLTAEVLHVRVQLCHQFQPPSQFISMFDATKLLCSTESKI